MNKIPQSYALDFVIGSGSSSFSEPDAEKFAYRNAIQQITYNKEVLSEPLLDKIEYYSKQTDESNVRKNERILELEDGMQITGASTVIKDIKIWEKCSKYENGVYSVWILVSTPKENPISPPSSFSPVWRSFLLPGWGQLYKEETFKGISFMTLCLGGVAGGLVFDVLSKNAANNASSSRTQPRRDFFNDEADNYSTFSTISFITAGVFYVWSLFDAIMVKQDILYMMLNQKGENTVFSISFEL